MKKFIKTFLIVLLIVPCVIGLSACSLFGGSGDSSGDGNNAETTMEITGEIPFNLNNDFYFYVESKPATNALNPTSFSFIAMRKNDDTSEFYSAYAKYTYYKYKNYTDYEAGIYKEKYVEERTSYEGINFRKSSAEKTNTSGNIYNVYYPEEWNTKVPANTTMTTTITYIEDFINGNHIADIPYQNEVAQTTLIPSNLSQDIHQKNVGIPSGTSEFEIYNDGTQNITFARFENDDTIYEQPAHTASVTKYKGVWYEQDVMNIQVWGNIVVSATPVQGETLMKKIINAKFSTEVSQETFEALLTACGYTADPVI